MSLIEREALRSELLSLTYYGEGEYYSGREAERDAIIDRLNEQPTIDPIRAAGGCYCRECKRYGPGPFGYGCHTMFDGKAAVIPHDLDYFCGDSELREAKDDD